MEGAKIYVDKYLNLFSAKASSGGSYDEGDSTGVSMGSKRCLYAVAGMRRRIVRVASPPSPLTLG